MKEEQINYFQPGGDLPEKDQTNYFQPGGDLSAKDQTNYFQPGGDLPEKKKTNYFQPGGDLETDGYKKSYGYNPKNNINTNWEENSKKSEMIEEMGSMIVTKEQLQEMINEGYQIIKEEDFGALVSIQYEKINTSRKRGR